MPPPGEMGGPAGCVALAGCGGTAALAPLRGRAGFSRPLGTAKGAVPGGKVNLGAHPLWGLARRRVPGDLVWRPRYGARFNACIRGNLVAWPTRCGRRALRVLLPERVAEDVATVLVMRTDCLRLQDLGKGREGALVC
jgi:hypothetical protein